MAAILDQMFERLDDIHSVGAGDRLIILHADGSYAVRTVREVHATAVHVTFRTRCGKTIKLNTNDSANEQGQRFWMALRERHAS